MRAILFSIVVAVGLAPLRPAAAGSTELRYLIAKLQESLDAGLARAEFHSLRIDIGAEIRLQRLYGTNTLANLPEFARALSAVDQAWAMLASAAPCQIDKGVVPGAKECHDLVEPMYKALGLPTPDLTGQVNPGTLIQPLLQALQSRSETTLRALQ